MNPLDPINLTQKEADELERIIASGEARCEIRPEPIPTWKFDLFAMVKRRLANIVANPDEWLATPNYHFGGRKPSELIGADNEHLVWEWMEQVEHGMFS